MSIPNLHRSSFQKQPYADHKILGVNNTPALPLKFYTYYHLSLSKDFFLRWALIPTQCYKICFF